jgi:ubiquinol-cytochrome c reductase iron-sulfur subunit
MPERTSRRRLSRRERAPALAFVVSILAAVALGSVYWRGGQPQLEGVLLAVALGGVGVGIVLWTKHFLPHGPFVEDRGAIASSEEEIAAFVSDFEAGGEEISRRGLLAKLLVGALGALGLAALFPIRSLGPQPGRGLKVTAYAGPPKRLVLEDGRVVTPADLPVDAVLTVYPEGHVTDPDVPTLLIHLRPGTNQPDPGRADWAVGDIVAYSKLCTHLGCPVGLYQAASSLLLCPCHQSTFKVTEGSAPIFGPATRPLPQLPIALDDAGDLISTGDFSAPVGPGFWDRDRS